MRRNTKLVCGVGINDADYRIADSELVDGRWRITWECPYYARWAAMLVRTHAKSYQKDKPTYAGVKVCDEWLVFSNFRNWMVQQDWEGKHLDKDILGGSKRIYSPETCIFVDSSLNCYLNVRHTKLSTLPIGVTHDRKHNRFVSRCQNPRTSKRDYLGYYHTPEQAHKAWQLAKWKYGQELLQQQTDPCIIQAMHVILHNLGNDWAAGRETKTLTI